MSSSRTRWLAAIVAGCAAPPVAVLAAGYTLAWRDTARLFGPTRSLVVEALREFRLPLWNPYESLGMPLFAQLMHGVLHPVSVVVALVAPGAPIDVLVVAYVVLAGLGAAVLARQLGASPAASAVAAFGFGLSGYVLSMSGILQYLAAAGTAPWAIAGIRAAGARGRFGFAAAAAGTAAAAFAGDPQWAVVAVLLGAALAADAGGRRGLAAAAAGVGVGVLLAAVQLAPAWAYLQESNRGAGLDPRDVAQWQLSPWRVVELVAPGFFAGSPREMVAPVFLDFAGPSWFPLPFVYGVSVGSALLMLAGLGARASRAARILAWTGAASLWIALGTALGATQVLGHVPVWRAFRYAEKLVGPLTLCIAVCAALGADRVARGERPWRAWAIGSAAIVLGLAGLALAPTASERVLAALGARTSPALARSHLLVGLAHATGGLVLLGAALAWPPARRAFPAAAAGIVLVQSSAAAPFSLHAGASGVRETEPLRGIRAPGPVTRVAHPSDLEGASAPKSLDEWDQLVAADSRMGDASFNVPARFDALATLSGIPPGRVSCVADALAPRFGPARWVAWRRYTVTHVAVGAGALETSQDARAAVSGGALATLDRSWAIAVWAVPHRPWASFAPAVVAVPSPAQACARTAEATASGDASVVVEAAAALPAAPGRVLAAERGTERIRIEAESAGDGVLVVNDGFAPGWEATIDGRSVPILPADGAVRAVPWPAGRHVLEMRYAPREVTFGLVLSGVGVVLLAWALWAAWRAGRPPAAAPPPARVTA